MSSARARRAIFREDFAERLHADLQAKGVRCWFAPEDLKIGDRFQERIEESIRVYDKVMIALSDASVKSRWVEREVNAAMEREGRENRPFLFPIRIDEAVMEAPPPGRSDSGSRPGSPHPRSNQARQSTPLLSRT